MRGATDGLLPEPVGGLRSKHPQPVLDILPSSNVQEGTIAEGSQNRSRASLAANGHHPVHSQGNEHANSESDEDEDDEDDGLHMPQQQRQRRPTSDLSQARQVRPNLSPATSELQQGGRARTRDGQQRTDGVKDKDKDNQSRMRHGWEMQLESQEQATLLSQTFFMYFEDKRHETAGNPPPDYDPKNDVSEWRMKDRLKTVSAILAVCLNVGVDPPDVIKPNPCARLECWVDPLPPEGAAQGGQSSNNTNAQIGKNLQSQYENLSLRTRYKLVLDPTIEELKRFTTNLRRTSHQERILFHYNGHGVPKPTGSGEVWCFNRSYTQYIPISLYDLCDWVGAPGLWVWDCSNAGGIIKGFLEGVAKHSQNQAENMRREPGRAQQGPQTRWEDCIHLAACRENEVLPTNPQLSADVFTSCLTTPIAMAVRFFLLQNPLPSTNTISLDTARNIPGKVSERRTPLGELNWIFTAITDTIAWNCLSKPLFKKLFRQDLMVAALFRNFLLAQRVMRIYHCHPVSYPAIPDTHNHPLWQSWDLAVEMILAQLPKLVEQQKAHEAANEVPQNPNNAPNGSAVQQTPQQASQQMPQELEYIHSDFFADQLSAFEVYLSSAPANAGASGYGKPPEQLPIVLQVLLSQVHRLRALILLSKFLDLGPWAVNLALSIGIFPYVLKLLQSQALELKPPMVFIWARILAVDQSCQSDLLKDAGFTYFTAILNSATGIPLGNVAEHRAMCAFVIAMFCKDFRPGRQAVLDANPDIIESCLQHLLDMENPLLRQFSCLCLGHLWKDFPPAKAVGLSCQAHARVRDRSHDPVPEVRAACLHALTAFVGTGVGEGTLDPAVVLEEETLASVLLAMGMDGSIMVRKELTVFYSGFMKKYEGRVVVAAWEQLLEERDKRFGVEDGEGEGGPSGEVEAENGTVGNGHADESQGAAGGAHRQRSASAATADTATSLDSNLRPTKRLSKKTIYRAMWRQILSMSADPHPEVAKNASIVVDYIFNSLLDSPLGEHANSILDELVVTGLARDQANLSGVDGLSKQRSRDARPHTPPSPSAASTLSKQDTGGYFGTLSRTASMAFMMKSLFGGGRTPTEPSADAPTSPAQSQRNSLVGGGPAIPYRSRPLTPGDAAMLPPDGQTPYKSRPLTPADAAMLPPDAMDHKIKGPPHQAQAKVPVSPNFTERDPTQAPQIPLQSNFFTWSSSYFREPQMRPSESDEPGSLDYNERLWRRNRNDKIIASTQPLKDAAGSRPWDVPCGYFGIGAAPVKMVFHQFENHLVTSDDRDSIAVWDWKAQKQLCRFSNGNPPGSRVTELRFINEDDQAMLMTGSSDGVIRVFRNYDNPNTITLATAFRALSDLIASTTRHAGLVFAWQQGQGRVLVAGDDRVIRVWQAGHELGLADIPARSGSCITSLTSDQVEGHVFVAGFGNGSLRAYDQRLPPRDSMTMAWVDRKTDHRSWIVGVHLQRGGLRELVSAESNGGVRLWDLRQRGSVAALPSPGPKSPSRSLRSLSVHEHAPLFATGSADHTIRVYNTSTLRQLSSAEPYMSYLRIAGGGLGASLGGGGGPRNAPITATALHPHRMMLACGAVNDGHVNLFRCDVESYAGKSGDGGVVEEWRG
ncbi:hypothetical protein B0A50_05513 [Salinomyces thailandicus]|uniref:Raptor N-terminal CASPase-like domain-containing protein n=1 Tax=Salinomyces thailandicus TaxID=706561 RepID=A0A4U0TUK6_9PEZI|nr:hypothetical protein B0A50_05513 [Salinomyces thailandica]